MYVLTAVTSFPHNKTLSSLGNAPRLRIAMTWRRVDKHVTPPSKRRISINHHENFFEKEKNAVGQSAKVIK